MSNEFTKYLKSKGTERWVTVHDMPEHNRVAERLNQTLVKWVCAIMHACGLLKSLWGEAVMHATWVKNRTSTCRLRKKTPYKTLYKKKPSLENLPVWGCHVQVHDMSSSKLDMRVRDRHWVGFDPESDGHWIYFPDCRTVSVEHSIAFKQHDVSVPPQTMESALIKGEQAPHVESVEPSMKAIETTVNQNTEGLNTQGIDQHATPECQNTSNTPVDHLGHSFESLDPQPMLC